jgi:4-alpha-glucanotransferase
MSWEELRYRPHRAQLGDREVIVVVRDRDLSNAQESGMDAGWFIDEVRARTRGCDFPPLVTTATDGDNGGWFRNTTHGSNFWSSFYEDLVDRVGAGASGGIRPALINDYLDRHGAHGWVTVETGAWNTGDHHGTGFVQWTGSGAQRDALARIAQVSDAVRAAGQQIGSDEPAARLLEQARWRVLRAETSCNLYWGEAWVPRCHADLDEAAAQLEQALGAAHAPA